MRGHIALQSILREIKTLRCRVPCSQRAEPSAEDLGLQTFAGNIALRVHRPENITVASVRTGLSACFAYLVGVDAVDTATDFGPTALRLTGAAEVLDEASELAQISAWASV
jgi:hypothetical protein